MPSRPARLVFEGFELDLEGGRLLREGQERPLERRAFSLLVYLAARPGRLVSKDELLREVWGAKVLSEGVVSNTIAKLRRALGQSRGERPIETVHGRGYRFHAQALAQADATATLDVQAQHAHAPQPSALEADARDPFVGRQALLARLSERLGRAGRGAENVVVLSGEAGIGKTRTARELAAVARARGMRVWTGAAHEGEGAPPYWPFVQLLRRAREDLPEAVWQRCSAPSQPALGELLSELGTPRVPHAAREPQTARFLLFDAVARFVIGAAADRPLLLVFDDLHWADAATLELLAFVARQTQEAPVTLLATLRSGELAGAGTALPLSQLSRVATLVPLEGLGQDEVAQLARALGSEEALRGERAQVLHQRTQGNPLFVRQALDLMAQRGDFSLVDDPASTELPETVARLIQRRLAALAEPTRAALRAAAVLGTDFELGVLAELLAVPQAELLERLEPALRMQVLQPCGRASSALRFAHVVTRDALCDELGLGERGALHARVADVLHARTERGAHHAASELAHHGLRARPLDVPRAVHACLRAAHDACEASAFEAAIDVLTRAEQCLHAEGGAPELRFALQLQLGENLFYASRLHAAWHAFRAAADAAERMPTAAARAERLAEVAPRLVDCTELATGDPSVARRYVDHALRDLPEHDLEQRAGLLAQRAELSLDEPLAARLGWLDEAASLAERSGSVAAVLEVAHSRAVLRDVRALGDCKDATARFFALVERHPAVAEGMRYRTLRRLDVHVSQYVAASSTCDLPSADAALAACEQLASSSHIAAARFVVTLMRAGRALAEGALDALEPLALGLLGSGDGIEHAAQRVAGGSYFAALLEARGELDRLASLDFDTGFELPNAPPRYLLFSRVTRARLYALTGRLPRARALLAQLPAEALARMPAHYGDLGTLCALAEIAWIEGDRVTAERLHAQLAPYAGRNALLPAFEYRGAVAYFTGLLARTLGRAEQARRDFEQAVAVNRALGMPEAAARAQRALTT